VNGVNGVNGVNNTNLNRVNNTAVNRVNRVNNTAVNNTAVNRVNRVNRVNNRPKNKTSRVVIPSGGLFAGGFKPKFLGGTRSVTREVQTRSEKNFFIPSSKFKNSKPGYSFYRGNKGMGYYKNTSRVEGPQLPPVPTNDDLALELAIARVKQLGLKQESKFLKELNRAGVRRKDVVARAELANKEEKNLVSFLNRLNIDQASRNKFINRMSTNDFKLLRVQAQLKADEMTNVKRTNEEKMSLALNQTNLGNVDKDYFRQRARRNGANIDRLIQEAIQMNANARETQIDEKRNIFRKMISNINLNNADKEGFISQINMKTNLTNLESKVKELEKKRINQKRNIVSENLRSFLTPLKINQTNKNRLVQKFKNENVTMNSVKNEAIGLLRTQLNTNLNGMNLNQKNKNAIIQKFTNGNLDVNKLISEAKQVKGATVLNARKQELQTFLNETVLPQNNKQSFINRLNTENANMNTIKREIKELDKVLRNKGKSAERNAFSTFLNELKLGNENRTNFIQRYDAGNFKNLKNLQNEAQKMRREQLNQKKIANKDTLKQYMNSKNLSNEVKINIEKRFNSNEADLNTLRTNINKIVANKLKQTKNTFINNVSKSNIPQNKKNEFIRRLNANNINMTSLRTEFNTMIKNMITEKRKANRSKLEEYLKKTELSNENKAKILEKFDTNNQITYDGITQEVNATVALKIQETKNKNKQKLDAYMNQMGLNKNNRAGILKMNVNFDEGKEMANRLFQTKMKQKRAQNFEKLNQHLNKLNVARANRKQFYTSLNQRVNLNTIFKNANSFAVGSKEKKFRELMNTLNTLTNENRSQLENKLNGVVTNWAELERFATTRAIERAKQKRVSERKKLVNFMNSIKLNAKAQEQLLENLDAALKNVDALKRNAIRKKLDTATNNISAKEKANIMNRFDKQNITLNFALKEVEEIKAKKAAQLKKNAERKDLSNHMNSLNLNNTIKGEFLNKFDKSNGNIGALKNAASKRKSEIVAAQRKANRNALSNFLNTIDELNETNKKTILDKFDTNNKETLETIKIAAQNLQKQKIVQKRFENRKEVSKYLNELVQKGLTAEEKNAILGKFNKNMAVTANAIKKEASNVLNLKIKTKIEENRKSLQNYISTLKISKENQNKILKKFQCESKRGE
jgi:hypothetical protein